MRKQLTHDTGAAFVDKPKTWKNTFWINAFFNSNLGAVPSFGLFHSVQSEDKFCAFELSHFITGKMMGSQAEQINERFHAIRRKLSEQNYKETFGAE